MSGSCSVQVNVVILAVCRRSFPFPLNCLSIRPIPRPSSCLCSCLALFPRLLTIPFRPLYYSCCLRYYSLSARISATLTALSPFVFFPVTFFILFVPLVCSSSLSCAPPRPVCHLTRSRHRSESRGQTEIKRRSLSLQSATNSDQDSKDRTKKREEKTVPIRYARDQRLTIIQNRTRGPKSAKRCYQKAAVQTRWGTGGCQGPRWGRLKSAGAPPGDTLGHTTLPAYHTRWTSKGNLRTKLVGARGGAGQLKE